MEYFDVVLSLGRMALGADRERAQHQLEKLVGELEVANPTQAAKIRRLLTQDGRKQTMTPMAFDEMRATVDAARRRLPGEVLSPSTPLPHDKETGAPLATVRFFGAEAREAPVLEPQLSAAIRDLLREWQQADQLARVGVMPHTRCLIYGDPGVGKTKLAHYISAQMGLPCVEARLDGLVSSFLGTTARNIGALFDFANRYQCVLFLDEFDAIAKARDDAQEIGEIKRVVNSLLQAIDRRGDGGFTLAATNHEHLLDSAVWRRFDAKIHIQRPNRETRSALLDHFSQPLRLQKTENDFFTWATERMSGADIEIIISGVKRYLVLHGSGAPNGAPTRDPATRAKTVLDAIRHQALINAMLFSDDRRNALLGEVNLLTSALVAAGFTQTEVGTVLGISQSAVSRRRGKM